MTTPDRSAMLSEITISVALTSLLAAGTFVLLAAVLLGSRSGFGIPALFLVVAALGFLLGALAYGNASGELARLQAGSDSDKEAHDRRMRAGNIVSEYFGVYFLVYAIPPTVFISQGANLGAAVLCVVTVGFVGYHVFRQSVLQRYFRGQRTFYLVVSLLTVQLVVSATAIGMSSSSGLAHILTIPAAGSTILSSVLLAAFSASRREESTSPGTPPTSGQDGSSTKSAGGAST